MDAVKRVELAKPACGIGGGTFLSSEAGSATVEFAMAIPVVLLLVAGAMVTMVGLMMYGNLTYATGVAARYAALHGGGSDAPADARMVSAQVQSHVWMARGTQVTTSWSAGNLPGSVVKVVTVVRLPLAVPLSDGQPIVLRASSARVVVR